MGNHDVSFGGDEDDDNDDDDKDEADGVVNDVQMMEDQARRGDDEDDDDASDYIEGHQRQDEEDDDEPDDDGPDNEREGQESEEYDPFAAEKYSDPDMQKCWDILGKLYYHYESTDFLYPVTPETIGDDEIYEEYCSIVT